MNVFLFSKISVIPRDRTLSAFRLAVYTSQFPTESAIHGDHIDERLMDGFFTRITTKRYKQEKRKRFSDIFQPLDETSERNHNWIKSSSQVD